MQRGRGRRGTIHGRFKGVFIGGVANEADGGEHGWKEGEGEEGEWMGQHEGRS